MNLYQFVSSIAWPTVALIAIFILGPGGILKNSIIGLADKLMSIRSSVEEFQKISEDFNLRRRSMAGSLQWLKESSGELIRISSSLEAVRQNTNDMVLGQGERQIAEKLPNENTSYHDDAIENLSSDQMFDIIYKE